jgi:hypothetical protein
MRADTPTAPRPAFHGTDELLDHVRQLARDARRLWRREPTSTGPVRDEALRDLTMLQLDLEALERRRTSSEPCVEHERALHDCASRLERLRLHWRSGRG